MAKGPEAFRTISEASAELGVPSHVLRFWETRFSFVRPMKRAGGRRFYRRQDVDVLRGVRALLHDEGYTIKGVQRLHREHGLARLLTAAGAGAAMETAGIPAEAPLPDAAPPPEPSAPPQPAAEELVACDELDAWRPPAPSSPEPSAPQPPEPPPPEPLAVGAALEPAAPVPEPAHPALGAPARRRLREVLDDLEAARRDIERVLASSPDW